MAVPANYGVCFFSDIKTFYSYLAWLDFISNTNLPFNLTVY